METQNKFINLTRKIHGILLALVSIPIIIVSILRNIGWMWHFLPEWLNNIFTKVIWEYFSIFVILYITYYLGQKTRFEKKDIIKSYIRAPIALSISLIWVVIFIYNPNYSYLFFTFFSITFAILSIIILSLMFIFPNSYFSKLMLVETNKELKKLKNEK